MIVSACKHELIKKFGKNRNGTPRVRCTLCGKRKYSPAAIISMKKEAVWNLPSMDRVCTSHIERHNLTLRTFIKRSGVLEIQPRNQRRLGAGAMVSAFGSDTCSERL
jgi:hypothetical protein